MHQHMIAVMSVLLLKLSSLGVTIIRQPQHRQEWQPAKQKNMPTVHCQVDLSHICAVKVFARRLM